MPRGRPIKSEIRQNMIEILFFMKKATGYDIYKVYKQIFPKVTLRSIYYHLKKGKELNEFNIEQVKEEKGEYSWGNTVEKIYYSLGPNAKPKTSQRVKDFFESKK